MSTQLTTVPNAPNNAHLAIEGMEGLTQRDIILPRWSLIQPTSRKTGADDHVGEFMRNLDGVFQPHLDVVVLMIQPSRLLWSGDQSEKRPECFSRDGVNGSVYGACNACQFNVNVNASLLDAIRAKEDVKACQYGYTFVMIDDVEMQTPALLGAMGTSVRPAKILTSQFALRKRPPFTALVRIESERQTNERGKFYVLKPSILRWLDEAEQGPWRTLWQEMRGVTIKDVDEDEVAADGGADSF